MQSHSSTDCSHYSAGPCQQNLPTCTSVQVKDAMGAVALLHNHSLQGQDAPVNSVKGKKTGQPGAAQALAEGALLWARQVSGEGAHLKKWRLILRNLPFNVRARPCGIPALPRPALPGSLTLHSDSCLSELVSVRVGSPMPAWPSAIVL